MNDIFKSLYVHMNCVGLSSSCIYSILIPKTSNKLWGVVGYGRIWSQRRYQRLWRQPVKVFLNNTILGNFSYYIPLLDSTPRLSPRLQLCRTSPIQQSKRCLCMRVSVVSRVLSQITLFVILLFFFCYSFSLLWMSL